MQARYYEGGRGQFLSQDPVFWEVGQTSDGKTILTNPQLANSYSYAGNNPINGRDPSGRSLADQMYMSFNMMPANMPTNYPQQLQNALLAVFGAPMAAAAVGGIAGAAVLAPAVSPVLGSAVQGAIVGMALRATNDVQSGERSSAGQYAGSAAFGATTGAITSRAGPVLTAGVSGISSAMEGWASDRSVQGRQVVSNAFGSGVGQVAGSAIANTPALKSFAPVLGPAIGSLTTYGVTAASTAALISNDKKK